MVWIVIVGALAVAGAVAVALYAVQLTRRLEDVRHELSVTTGRIMEIRAVAERVELPRRAHD